MKLTGTPVSAGVGIGPALRYEAFNPEIVSRKITVEQVAENKEHYLAIREEAANQLRQLMETFSDAEQHQGKIFKAHISIVYDEAMHEEVLDAIENGLEAPECALNSVFSKYAKMLGRAKDPLISERAADIEDVRNRLLRLWFGAANSDLATLNEPVVLVAKDLLPSDTASMKKENVLAVVTEVGGTTSHTAILAKTYGIPAVLGVDGVMDKVADGDQLVVNALEGFVDTEPDEETLMAAQQAREAFLNKVSETRQYLSITPLTQDGHRVKVCLNIGSDTAEELANAQYSDGVGLLRSEFLYMSRSQLPTESEQFEAYKNVLQAFDDRPVILRTLDIGGDKQLGYLDIPKEDNPFLGLRALRLCFEQMPIFKTQIRAALRASVYGNLQIMFPMVGSIGDIRFAKQIVEEVKGELRIEGIDFDREIKLGIMVEIPSIALMADLAAEEVDFASIGTNDLCQYLTAVDRLNPKVAQYYQSYHPAMFRIIANVAKAFTSKGKELSVCGEMGGDPLASAIFIGLGIRKLSMNASSVANVKKMVSNLDSAEAEKAAETVLTLATAAEVEDYIKETFPGF